MAQFGYKADEFPPLAPNTKGTKPKGTEQFERLLKIKLALTGESVAEFPASSGCKLSIVCEKLREIRPVPLGLDYELSFGDNLLQPDSYVGKICKESKPGEALELQARVCQVGSIVLPGVTGVAELPESGDLIVASSADITGGRPLKATGQDDGQSSYMWLFRLKKSYGYALQHATLLCRRQCYTTEELWQHWNECVDWLKTGDRGIPAWDDDVIEQFGETPEALPHTFRLEVRTCLHAHNEKYVLVAWNKELPAESRGVVDRLDTETGEIKCIAKTPIISKAVSDPRDGTVFCSIVCVVSEILQLRGTTVTNPNCDGQKAEENLVVADMGPAFDFDAEFLGGCLVAPSKGSRSRSRSIIVALPPEADRAEALKFGAVECSSPLERTPLPGDKTTPWHIMNFPEAMPAYMDHEELAFSSKAGKVMALDNQAQTVHVASLGADPNKESFVAQPPLSGNATLETALSGFVHDGGCECFVFSTMPE
eukprot:TRINITY_DN12207_c0_g1_i2.p1 TRINITY_DN12207_c0_g1~~TRINITY_DN12207_c0_g1_i2.p1  ORF type:complete len:483 (+),score=83.84 TRINITY_DN12207_c0_g1_i2:38-1486(+)